MKTERLIRPQARTMMRQTENMGETARLRAAMDGRGGGEEELHTEFWLRRLFGPSAQLT